MTPHRSEAVASSKPHTTVSRFADHGAGRPVPPHGSGGSSVSRRNDPDETGGRALYRQLADAEARMQMAATRKARLLSSAALHQQEPRQ